MAIQEMTRLGNPLLILAILPTNDISKLKIHMHMPCMPKLVQEHTCNSVLVRKSDVAIDLDVLLHFPTLPLPPCSKNPSMSYPPRVFQESSISKSMTERIGEISNIELTKSCPLILRSLFINEAYIFFIFHYFPSFSSSHETCDLSPPIFSNFHYFYK